jgi:hypothetical protein
MNIKVVISTIIHQDNCNININKMSIGTMRNYHTISNIRNNLYYDTNNHLHNVRQYNDNYSSLVRRLIDDQEGDKKSRYAIKQFEPTIIIS